MSRAADAPLRDFGLRKDHVPAALAQIDNIYAAPLFPGDCATLNDEVGHLDQVLGYEVIGEQPDDRSLSRKGMDSARKAAQDGARDLTTGWIPFRGIVRKVTGAEQAEKRIEDAIDKGRLRRAYLRGLMQARGCPYALPAMAAQLSAAPIEVRQPAQRPLIISRQ